MPRHHDWATLAWVSALLLEQTASIDNTAGPDWLLHTCMPVIHPLHGDAEHQLPLVVRTVSANTPTQPKLTLPHLLPHVTHLQVPQHPSCLATTFRAAKCRVLQPRLSGTLQPSGPFMNHHHTGSPHSSITTPPTLTAITSQTSTPARILAPRPSQRLRWGLVCRGLQATPLCIRWGSIRLGLRQVAGCRGLARPLPGAMLMMGSWGFSISSSKVRGCLTAQGTWQ